MSKDEYTGPYALGDKYAKVTCGDQKDENRENLECPKCGKQLKSSPGYTNHLKNCWPEELKKDPFQERHNHQPKGVWELCLETFHEDLKVVDPKAYFITSGEAVIKAKRMYEDFKAAMLASKKLISVLRHLKNDAKYLETQWDTNKLLLKKKNPRPSSRSGKKNAKK